MNVRERPQNSGKIFRTDEIYSKIFGDFPFRSEQVKAEAVSSQQTVIF